MKKIIFAAAMLLVVSSVSAQKNSQVFVPKKGDFTVDLRLSSPFNNNNDRFISSESAMTENGFFMGGDGIDVRYFLNEKFAVKGIFSIFNFGDKTFDDPTDKANRSYQKYSTTTFILGAGIEYRLGNFNKFYPYAGAGVGVGIGSEKYTDVYDVDGDTKDTNTDKYNGTAFMFNINLGADYYLSNHFYVGFEVGLNYTNAWYKGDELVHTDTRHSLVTYCVPSLRMGWKF